MRRGEEFAQHGFDLLSKRSEPEQFFDALRDRGFFDASNNSGPVPSANPDFVHVPFWWALNYLVAVAKRSAELDDAALAEKILAVVRTVTLFKDSESGAPRDNYQTYYKFAEIFGIVPLRCITISDIDLIRIWLSSKFDSGLVPHALTTGLLKRLFSSGSPEDITKATKVIEVCLAFEWNPKRRKRSEDVATVVDDYWLKEMLSAYAGELGRKAGAEAMAVFDRGLRDLFSDERRNYGTTLWRPAIETNPQNRDWHGAENRLVEGMRDALDGWIETSASDAGAYVAGALRDDGEIIRRIALNAVTEHFEVLREVFEPIIGVALFASGHRHELYRLLSTRFAEMSSEAKAKVIEAIRKLPEPSRGEDRDRRLKFTQREWLSAIKDQPEASAWFAELKAVPELGSVSDHPDFLMYHESRWGPGPAPFEADSLVTFAEDGTLIDRLNGFQPGDTWRGPTLDGLVSALEAAVAQKPNTFLPLLSDFHAAKVPFQYAVIQGFKKLFDPSNEKKPEFDWRVAWPKLMAFFSKTVGRDEFWQKVEERKKVDHTPTYEWMRSLIADFLANATRDDDKAYPTELLPQGWEIIKRMLSRAEAGELNLKDPMMSALNTDKGHVIGALFNHALRACRVADQTTKTHESTWAELKDVFDTEIALCRNENFEFSTLAASYIANLDYMSRAWLAENVATLFPSRVYPNNFKVAIGGLAYANGVSRSLYLLLAKQDVFSDALATKLEDKNGRERVIEWVGLAYLWDDEQLESSILKMIFAAGVEDVETLVELFWQVRRDELSEKQVEKILAFWEHCLTWSERRGGSSDHFMARLSRLSPFISLLNERNARLLTAVVPYVHSDYGSDQMVGELSRLVDSNPAGVAELLERMLDASAPNFDLDDKLKHLIEKLANLGLRAEAIRCAEKVRRTLPGMLELYKRLIAGG
jgi:hypothetical protein